jgi:hypothetical protein
LLVFVDLDASHDGDSFVWVRRLPGDRDAVHSLLDRGPFAALPAVGELTFFVVWISSSER